VGYPETVDERRFEFLNHNQLLARRRDTRNDFAVLIVRPAIIGRTRIKVAILVHWVGLTKGQLVLGMSDWAEAFFRFDCKNGEFKFDQVQLGGIEVDGRMHFVSGE
jgi:hypothetical protein